MAVARTALVDFALANPNYIGASISAFEVDTETWDATTTLAPLYRAPTGTTTHGNPIRLDGDGKWPAPVYIDRAVILRVTGAVVPSHDTAVINPPPSLNYTGDWVSGQVYAINDIARDGAAGDDTGNLYLAATYHAASSSWSTDLAGEKWQLFLAAAATSADDGSINVLAYGAAGDGVSDDTTALLAALAAAPDDGGTVIVPVGYTFLFSAPLPLKANTHITGGGTLKAAPITAWAASPYYGLTNVNASASSITDENITISGITIDYTAFPAADGTRHCIYIRRARNVRVEGVTILGGSSACALVGCDNTQEIGNTYDGFSNCGSDHWDQPNNTRVIGCHIKSAVSVGQMMNYNPDPTSGASVGYSATNFVFTGNTIDATGNVNTVPCIVSPLGADKTVKNFVVSNNNFINASLIIRGDTSFGSVVGNVLSGFAGTTEAITGYTRLTGTPAGIVISGNVVRDAITSVGSLGVIRMESNSSSILNNIVEGTAYGCQPYYVGSSTCQMFGNRSDKTPQVSGALQVGFSIPAGTASTSFIGWTDLAGNTPRIYLQDVDKNWIFASTGSSGAVRVVDSIIAASDTSELIRSVPSLFSSTIRNTPVTIAAAGTTIGTATVLTANFNEVTTATAGVADGVRLSASNAFMQVVTNSTSVTINVFPQNSGSGSIDGGAAAAPVTILAGKSKVFFQYSTNNYRTVAQF